MRARPQGVFVHRIAGINGAPKGIPYRTRRLPQRRSGSSGARKPWSVRMGANRRQPFIGCRWWLPDYPPTCHAKHDYRRCPIFAALAALGSRQEASPIGWVRSGGHQVPSSADESRADWSRKRAGCEPWLCPTRNGLPFSWIQSSNFLNSACSSRIQRVRLIMGS